MSSLPPAIFLMGPTAAGKTDLALELARVLPCDLISVDSALIDPELQSVEIQGRKMLFVWVGESTLWNQACQWCLTAFKAGLGLAISGAGLLTLVAAGRGATAICAATTTQTLALLFGGSWCQVADPHSCGGICCG